MDATTVKELPIFVIPNVVLLPNAMLPLHIFENRYHRMIEDCMKAHRRFVLVNGDSTYPLEVGCVAEIICAETAEGGTTNVLVAGRGRVRIMQISTSTEYPTAVVAPYDDDDASSKDIQDAVRMLAGTFKTYATLLNKVFDRDIECLVRLNLDAVHLSFIAACLIELPAREQQRVLSLRNTRERLLLVDQKMCAEISRLAALSAIRSAFAA